MDNFATNDNMETLPVSQGHNPAAATRPAAIKIAPIPIKQLHPNSYNPNRKSPEEYDEQKAEAKRLGRLPKPVVARRRGDDDFDIIDGEHGWKICRDLKWPSVDCEIVEADDFEARLQTLKRNQHGENDRVLLGCFTRR